MTTEPKGTMLSYILVPAIYPASWPASSLMLLPSVRERTLLWK